MASSSGDLASLIGQAMMAEETHFLTSFGYGVVTKAQGMGVSDEEVFKDMDYDDLKMLTVNIPTLARLRKYYRTLQEQHDDDGIPSKRSKMESTPHAKSKLFDSSMSLTHKSAEVEGINEGDMADLTGLSFSLSPTRLTDKDKSMSFVIRTPLDKKYSVKSEITDADQDSIHSQNRDTSSPVRLSHDKLTCQTLLLSPSVEMINNGHQKETPPKPPTQSMASTEHEQPNRKIKQSEVNQIPTSRPSIKIIDNDQQAPTSPTQTAQGQTTGERAKPDANQTPTPVTHDIGSSSAVKAGTSTLPAKPETSQLILFCDKLDMGTWILYPDLEEEELRKLRGLTRQETMTNQHQRKIIRLYVHHLQKQYKKAFGRHNPDKMVKTRMAQRLVELFPCLGDKYSSSKSGHEVLFRESPMSGLLYSSFKSMLFSQDIPPEEMERPGCRTKRNPLTSVENLELMTNDNYIETVVNLKTSNAYTTTEEKIMEDTFATRRKWILTDKSVDIVKIFQEYPIFARNPIEIHKEFRRLFNSYNDGMTSDRVGKLFNNCDGADSFGRLLKDLSRKAKVENVITELDPITACQNAKVVLISVYGAETSVCLPAPINMTIPVNSLKDAAILCLKIHWVANTVYPDTVKSLYGVLEGLANIKATVNLGTIARKVMAEILSP